MSRLFFASSALSALSEDVGDWASLRRATVEEWLAERKERQESAFSEQPATKDFAVVEETGAS